jgi:4-hydroxybenzoate polyprenyltransferase
VASAALFLAAAAWLGPLCLRLAPIVLVLVLGYSFTKRFTWLCHLFLGLAIGCAPAAAWIAVRGRAGGPGPVAEPGSGHMDRRLRRALCARRS